MLKSRGSTAKLVMGSLVMLAFLGVIMMRFSAFITQSQSASQTHELRDLGKTFFSDQELVSFRAGKYAGATSFSALVPEIEKLVDQLENVGREKMVPFLEIGIPWDYARAHPSKFVGVMFPTYVKKVQVLDEVEGCVIKLGTWLDLEHYNGSHTRILVQRCNKEQLNQEGFYLDLIYLGQVWEGEKELHFGVAREIYGLPNKGIFPMLPSLDIALSNIIDDNQSRDLLAHAEKLDTRTLMHFFGMIQLEALKNMPLKEGVGVAELLTAPERYRAEHVRFDGKLIALQKERIHFEGLPPGMEFYYRGYILNSDKNLYVFCMVSPPENMVIQFQNGIRPVIRMEGLFMQRFTYRSQDKKRIWAPLVVAGSLVELDEPSPLDILDEYPAEWLPLNLREIFIALAALFMVWLVVVVLKGQRQMEERIAQRRSARAKDFKVSDSVRNKPKKFSPDKDPEKIGFIPPHKNKSTKNDEDEKNILPEQESLDSEIPNKDENSPENPPSEPDEKSSSSS